MEFNWNAKNYREIVNFCLGYRNLRRPRGAVKRLADYICCHPTFIAQVLKERAHFSPEQGFEISNHFSFTAEQRDYFLVLLMRDRSGTPALRKYYQKKISDLLEKKRDLSPKKPLIRNLKTIHEIEYFGNWIYQAIHALTQITHCQSTLKIATFLNQSIDEVTLILNRLQEMKLVEGDGQNWKSNNNFLHLSKESPYIRLLHSTWKTKILSDLQNKKNIDGTRYSGLVTITEKDYEKIRDVLASTMESIRKIVEQSDAEKAYILSLDCYEI